MQTCLSLSDDTGSSLSPDLQVDEAGDANAWERGVLRKAAAPRSDEYVDLAENLGGCAPATRPRGRPPNGAEYVHTLSTKISSVLLCPQEIMVALKYGTDGRATAKELGRMMVRQMPVRIRSHAASHPRIKQSSLRHTVCQRSYYQPNTNTHTHLPFSHLLSSLSDERQPKTLGGYYLSPSDEDDDAGKKRPSKGVPEIILPAEHEHTHTCPCSNTHACSSQMRMPFR